MATCAVASIVLFSCKKDDNGLSSGSESDLVGTWQLVGTTPDRPLTLKSGKVISDLYGEYPDCFKDNLVTYKADGTFEYNEGATKCDPQDPQSLYFNWTRNGSRLTITSGLDATIIQLDKTTLKYSVITEYITRVNGNIVDNIPYVATVTLTRK